MEAIIKAAGGLIGGLGTYTRLIIVGVWFPGFLIFCELGSTYFALWGPPDKGLFSYLADRIKEFDSAVVSGFVIVFVLAASIAIGYVARDIAFAISDLGLRRGWRPVRRLAQLYADIRQVYGSGKVTEVAAKYPVFRLATGEADWSSLPRAPESYVREFCKQWLRLRVPSLNTEGLEIEINMVMGLVMPVALASVVWLSFFRSLLGTTLAGLSIAAAAYMLYRINWARSLETEQAMANFLFAHWEGLPTSNVEAGPETRHAERNHH